MTEEADVCFFTSMISEMESLRKLSEYLEKKEFVE